MRAYLAMQAMETGKGLGGNYLGRSGLMSYGHNGMLLGAESGQGKVCTFTTALMYALDIIKRPAVVRLPLISSPCS